MELELIRTYFASGTNGQMLYRSQPVVHTIELPWKDNHTGVSCIPEGRYGLVKRYSQKSIITGPGTSVESKLAANRLKALVFPALARSEPVFLTIKFFQHEYS